MPPPKLEVVQGGRETWLQHPYTKAQRLKAQRSLDVALKRLLNTCANSSDSDVLRAYHSWALLDHIATLLGPEERQADVER